MCPQWRSCSVADSNNNICLCSLQSPCERMHSLQMPDGLGCPLSGWSCRVPKARCACFAVAGLEFGLRYAVNTPGLLGCSGAVAAITAYKAALQPMGLPGVGLPLPVPIAVVGFFYCCLYIREAVSVILYVHPCCAADVPGCPWQLMICCAAARLRAACSRVTTF
jgi:hypothetical protein